MRAIDADKLKEVLEKNFGHTGGASVLAQLIDAQDTIQPSALGTDLAEVGTDCISRQQAINAIDECYCGGEDSCGEPWIYKENAVESIQMIEPIPTAEPKRGKCKWCERLKERNLRIEYYWIDQEGCTASFSEPHIVATGIANFCPNCGADMRGEQNG